jgi:hypothetical protein
MSARTRRNFRPSAPNALRVHRAQRGWETLASRADLHRSCDARRCAKLAKSRKQVHRARRRVVRQLMREVLAA